MLGAGVVAAVLSSGVVGRGCVVGKKMTCQRVTKTSPQNYAQTVQISWLPSWLIGGLVVEALRPHRHLEKVVKYHRAVALVREVDA